MILSQNSDVGNYSVVHSQDLGETERSHGTDLERGHLNLEQNNHLAQRLHSPGSLNGSLVVEPTEASSAHDNASVDGSSVRSYLQTR